MRYAQIRTTDISNGPGVGVALFTQGCPFHCPGCHNQSTWSFEGGKEFGVQEVETLCHLIEPDWITRFSLLGGEPFLPQNAKDLSHLLQCLKQHKPDINIWAWTGYELENMPAKAYSVLQWVDVLIDGPFIQEQKDFNLKYKGSENQRVIDVPKTLKENQVVLYQV